MSAKNCQVIVIVSHEHTGTAKDAPTQHTDLLAEGVLLGPSDSVVVVEGLLEDRSRDAHVLREGLTVFVALHEATADVVLAVPLDLLRRRSVEDEPDGELAVLPHLARDVVAVLELVDETAAGVVQEEAADTAERLRGQELDLRLGLVGVDEAGRVHLDLLEVDGARADGERHLLTITGTVLAIGGGEIPVLGAVLLEEGVRGEVGSVATGREDDGAIRGVGLALVLVLDTDNSTCLVLDELGDARLLLDLDARRGALREVLKTFHLGVGDDHARELSVATVCSGMRVATEASDLGEVEGELILEPVNGVAGLTSENADKVIACEVTSLNGGRGSVRKAFWEKSGTERHTERLVSSKNCFALSGIPRSCCDCVPEPLIPEVALVEFPPMKLWNAPRHQNTRIQSEEGYSRLLVEEKHVSTALKESVGGREASKTTTDNDCLSHC